MRQSFSTRLITAVAVATVLTLLGCAEEKSAPPPPPVPAPAEISADAVRLLDLDGHAYNLEQAVHDATTVFIFTRTDCPISNRYAPDIRQLYEDFHPRGVEFVLVYVDPRQQPDAIRDHLKEYEYPCSALRDPDHTLVTATGVTVTPEAVLLDADGKMAYRGRIDDRNVELGQARSAAIKHDLADAIEATLAGQPVAEPVTKAVGCNIADLK